MDGGNKSKPDGEHVPANYEPILPPELCRSVEEVWRRRGVEFHHPAPPTTIGSPYILTGILHCAECGQPLKGERRRHDGTRQYRHTRGKGGCPETVQLADPLEQQAIALLECLDIPPEVILALSDAFGADFEEPVGGELQAERDVARAQVSRLEAEVERLVDVAISTSLEDSLYRRKLEQLNADLRTARERLSIIEDAIRAEMGESLSVAERLRHLASSVEEADPETQRDLLASVFAQLTARGGRIESLQPREWCRPFWRPSPGL